MSERSDLERIRLEKIEKLRQAGYEPYPRRVKRTHLTQEAITAFEANEGKEQEVRAAVAGRIRSVRHMGKISFAHIEDGMGKLQLFFQKDQIGEEKLDQLKDFFDLGDFIGAEGMMFRTRTGEVTLRVEEFTILAKAVSPLPAAKEEQVGDELVVHSAFSDPETRYRQRYADLAVNPEIREVFRTRAKVIRSLQTFLDERGFLEVETPILQPIYGGAAARPFTTHHNQLHQDLYLRISFELYLKRLIVGGFEGVYEIGRDFRNEGVSFKHNPEFTQLEFYWAYRDYQDVMVLTEEMIAYVAEATLGSPKIQFRGETIDLSPPWKRLRLRDALQEASGIDIDKHPDADSLREAMRAKDLQASDKAERGKLIDSLLGNTLEPKLIQPTFIYDYPRDISPLAKTTEGDPNVVERFEGFVGGMELCNAFTELNDPIEQEARFREMGRDYADDDEERHPMDEDYLRALRYGMPPNGGFGMGVDRLVMLLTDKTTIREVILFPHLRAKDED
jgi:lysyl-tRNA synthetase class 2